MSFTSWAPSPSPSPALAPSPSPSSPSPAPSSSISAAALSTSSSSSSPPPPSKLPVDFSPPLIAMVVVVAAAFLIVTYSRLISKRLFPLIFRLLSFFRRRQRRRRFLPSTTTDLDSLPPSDPFDLPLSPFGLDDSAIKTLPLSLYTSKTRPNNSPKDCSVCLFEFEDDEYVRTLPVCSHAFHVDCIDVWLKSHANCPLCRAGIFATQSPFTPLMAARIRPSLDDAVFVNHTLDTLTETPFPDNTITEITEEPSPRRTNWNRHSISNCEERFNFVLKRSYSFGFERSLAAERMTITEPITASPWRYRRGGNTFWSKRASPFGSLMMKPRVFSFRYYRGMRASPFFRRRGIFPFSESSNRFSGGGGCSSRRSKSMASPMFLRSAASSVAAFSSSRLRCGDPEALLSPERFNRR